MSRIPKRGAFYEKVSGQRREASPSPGETPPMPDYLQRIQQGAHYGTVQQHPQQNGYQNQQQYLPVNSFEELANQIAQETIPQGWEDDPWIRARADQLVEYAYIGWVNGHQNAAQDPRVLNAARQQGYQEAMQGQRGELQRAEAAAYQRGYKVGIDSAEKQAKSAYERGIREGRKDANTSISKKDRKQILDEAYQNALDECRVIGESNPSMEPAAKALRRRIKKWMK